jgi:phage FluMu protein Com
MSKRGGFKQLGCKVCGEIVAQVDQEATAVTCSKCVQLEVNGGFSMTEAEYWAAVKSGRFVRAESNTGEESL